MPTAAAPANVDDPRYLVELAFKNLLIALSGIVNVYITGDTAQHIHPALLVKAGAAQEELAPGTGIFKFRVIVELQSKLDKQTTEQTEQQVRSVRQTFYRNDTDPRPMKDLANRLSSAVSQAFTCFGVVPVDEPAPEESAEVRTYIFRFGFDVHACANR